MTAPDTNIRKQTRRHKPSIIGISVAALAALVIGIVVFALPASEVNDQGLATSPQTTTGSPASDS